MSTCEHAYMRKREEERESSYMYHNIYIYKVNLQAIMTFCNFARIFEWKNKNRKIKQNKLARGLFAYKGK